jgi:MFS family permease
MGKEDCALFFCPAKIIARCRIKTNNQASVARPCFMPEKAHSSAKQISSVPLTLLAWFGGILTSFLGVYFFACIVRINHAWFWPALIAALPIEIVAAMWLRFVTKLTFLVQVDRENKMLRHGNPLVERPIGVGEALEMRRYGGIRYAYVRFPDGTGVSFLPTLLLYFGIRREGAQRRWRDLVA